MEGGKVSRTRAREEIIIPDENVNQIAHFNCGSYLFKVVEIRNELK